MWPIRAAKAINTRAKRASVRLLLKHVLPRLCGGTERIIPELFRTMDSVPSTLIGATHAAALNATEPSPESLINNFCQGAVLFGVHNSARVSWELPEVRSIILPENARLPRRVREAFRKNTFDLRCNHDFPEVVSRCKRQEWTWITSQIERLYLELHAMGFAWSIEAYQHDKLAGGIWGIAVGGTCSIMSMFHEVDGAGTVATGLLVSKLINREISVCDSGAPKPSFERFGAIAVPRADFSNRVVRSLREPLPSFLNLKTPPAGPVAVEGTP